MKRASSCALVAACLSLVAAGPMTKAWSQQASSTASPSLDYQYFKAKVEPVFLEKRPGHARCVVCHTFNNAPFHLVRLSPGSTSWTEEQSRRNFELVQKYFGDTVHVRELDQDDYPYPELFRLLMARDYSGWILLEARTKPNDYVAAMRRQRDRFLELVGS